MTNELSQLITQMANCKVLLDLGKCNHHDCIHCTIGKHMCSHFMSLKPFDKLYVKSRADMYSFFLSRTHYKERYIFDKTIRFSSNQERPIKIPTALLVCLILLCLVASFHVTKPRDSAFERRVKHVSEQASDVTDIDLDGSVDCCDEALYFYWFWTRYYREPCRLVVNYNKPAMNHMFVQIWYNNEWLDIEPGSKRPLEFTRIWGKSYNPVYNRYDSSFYWLRDDYVLPVLRRLDEREETTN